MGRTKGTFGISSPRGASIFAKGGQMTTKKTGSKSKPKPATKKK